MAKRHHGSHVTANQMDDQSMDLMLDNGMDQSDDDDNGWMTAGAIVGELADVALETAIESLVERLDGDDDTDYSLVTQPDGTTRDLLATTDDQPNDLLMVPLPPAADIVSDGDADMIVGEILRSTDDENAQTAASSVTNSAARYTIGLHAARLMIRHNLSVDGAALMIGQLLDRSAQITHNPIPRVWRDLSNIAHALKCWIPGTVDSSALPKMWNGRPFYTLPAYVVDRISSGRSGFDHGGMVCDYWSRISPLLIDRAMVESFDRLTKRADQREYLRQYLTR